MFDLVFYYLLAGSLINTLFMTNKDFENLEELFGIIGTVIATLILTIVWPVSGYFLLTLSRYKSKE